MSAASNSPTPVLDALEQRAGGPEDQKWAGALAQFVANASRVPILSLSDDAFPFGKPFEEAYPDPETYIVDEELWVECLTPIADGPKPDQFGNPKLVRTGVLIERIWPSERDTADPWNYDLLSLRFAYLYGDYLMLSAGRVMVAPTVYNFRAAGRSAETNRKIEDFEFADFERCRYGLQPAATASDVELLRMHDCVLDMEGRYIRGIPDGEVPVFWERAPRYSAAAEFGIDGLRAGLMAAYAEAWAPENLDALDPDIVTVLRGFMHCAVLRGPVIALSLLARLHALAAGRGVRTPLEPRFSRGRAADRFTLPASTATKP